MLTRMAADLVCRGEDGERGRCRHAAYGGYPETVRDFARGMTFERGRFIGGGSFGKCFVMRDNRTGKLFAGKVLKKSMLKRTLLFCFISEELAIHSLLKHRNIVTFFQAFDDHNYIYIILELCPYGSLLDLQRRRELLTLVETKYYVRQILLGLDYLHRKYIIHGDLKLSNIFLNRRMVAKIGDFGFSTVISYDGDEVGLYCGTPNYMAPEIIEKKGHSFAGDVWAVGCIFYALLVGKLPFQSYEPRTTVDRIKSCDFCTYTSGLRKQGSRFIRRILQRDPDARPSTGELLVDEFLSKCFIPPSLPASCLREPPMPQDLTSSTRLASTGARSTKSARRSFRKLGKNQRKLKITSSPFRRTPYHNYKHLVAL